MINTPDLEDERLTDILTQYSSQRDINYQCNHCEASEDFFARGDNPYYEGLLGEHWYCYILCKYLRDPECSTYDWTKFILENI